MYDFTYQKPASLADAAKAISAAEDGKLMAGGMTLIPTLKQRLARPSDVIDLGKIAELAGIKKDGNAVVIGAMTRHADVAHSDAVKAAIPALADLADGIGDPQVRNRGTIGGNLCSNDPTNHLPPLMAAIGAELTITGPRGERTVPAADFFLGVYMTAVGQDELLTRITVPAGKHDGFAAVTLGVDGTCIANAAATLDGTLRIALGCVDAVPVLIEAESADAVRAAVREAKLNPPSDVHASSEYRAHLAEVLAERAARQAVGA